MKYIIAIFIQTVIIMAAGIGWSCDDFWIRVLLYLLASFGVIGYHEYMNTIEEEEKNK